MTPPSVSGNFWFDYGGGSLPSNGNSFNDAAPYTSNPGITGTCELPQFGVAVTGLGIPQLPTSYGFPGWVGPPPAPCPWSSSQLEDEYEPLWEKAA